MFVYIRYSRLYGLKRFFVKLFYYKFFVNLLIDIKKKCCGCLCEIVFLIRLIVFVWFMIFVFVGLYRIIGRYCLGMYIYNDYINVVFFSELLIYIINMYFLFLLLGIVLVFDIVYVIVCFLLLFWLVKVFYKIYMFYELYICYVEENIDKKMNSERNFRD